MSAPDAEALTTTRLGRVLLAHLAGLDLWDFMDQIGEPIPGTSLQPTTSLPDQSQRRVQAGPHRSAVDLVSDRVAAIAANLDQLARCRDRLALLSAFAAAMYPGAVGAAAKPHLAAAAAELLPVARSLAAAPAAQWWWQPPDYAHQRWLGTGNSQPPRGAALAEGIRAQAGADEQEEQRWAARKLPWPPERGKRYSGTWWSPPLGSGVFTTTGPIDWLPAAELGCMTDSIGEDQFEVWGIGISPQARVWNITCPGDWGRLVARYPRDVTASRRHDWYQWTGLDCTWGLPDWPLVAHDWDGIHLSIAGYITAAGSAITATASTRTLLAGWDPDQTLWLNDVFTRVDRVGTWTGTPGPDAFPDVVTLPWLDH